MNLYEIVFSNTSNPSVFSSDKQWRYIFLNNCDSRLKINEMAAKNIADPDIIENNEDSADEMVPVFNKYSIYLRRKLVLKLIYNYFSQSILTTILINKWYCSSIV